MQTRAAVAAMSCLIMCSPIWFARRKKPALAGVGVSKPVGEYGPRRNQSDDADDGKDDGAFCWYEHVLSSCVCTKKKPRVSGDGVVMPRLLDAALPHCYPHGSPGVKIHPPGGASGSQLVSQLISTDTKKNPRVSGVWVHLCPHMVSQSIL